LFISAHSITAIGIRGPKSTPTVNTAPLFILNHSANLAHWTTVQVD
jgi:hypothetical protein